MSRTWYWSAENEIHNHFCYYVAFKPLSNRETEIIHGSTHFALKQCKLSNDDRCWQLCGILLKASAFLMEHSCFGRGRERWCCERSMGSAENKPMRARVKKLSKNGLAWNWKGLGVSMGTPQTMRRHPDSVSPEFVASCLPKAGVYRAKKPATKQLFGIFLVF